MAIHVRNKDGVMETYKIVGLKGENGVTPNITIGTVTTLEPGQQATVTKEGTNERPIFNFGIPKGADGTGGSDSSASIDDSTISTKKTWSSSKIESFVLTNNNTIWKDVNGENLSIEYTKEGYLREVEILGNTIQNQDNLSDIKHLGELYVDDDGKPKLDSQDRKQYKIEVESFNGNLGEYELEVGALNYNTGLNIDDNTKFRTKDFIKLDNWLIDSYQNITNSYGYNDYYTYVFYNKEKKYIAWKILDQLKKTDIPTGAEYFKFFTLYREGVLDEKTFQSNVWYSKKPKESYCESKRHKTTILMPCQLSKVGNISDRLYWDGSKGKYVVEKALTEKLTATSSNRIGDFTSTDELTGTGKYMTFLISGLPLGSTEFALNPSWKVVEEFHSGFRYYDGECINPVRDGFRIKILKSRLDTEDLIGFKNWLNSVGGINFERYKNIETIDTDITEELKLPTFINNTYISVTGGIQGSIKAKAPVDGGKVITTLQRENIELKATNEVQDELINTTMLATDEMYMMLEPLLAEVVNLDGKRVNPLLNMYVAMVERGIKEIENVPVSMREQVKEILAQLDN